MPHYFSKEFETNVTNLTKATVNLQSSLNKTQLISRANYNRLSERMNRIRFKITDLVDDMEELQYDLDEEDIKDRHDPDIEQRMDEFERVYDALKPVLGLAMLSYLNDCSSGR